MATLNRYAAEVMEKYPVHACTDITGFGLLGHAVEMSSASGMNMEVDSRMIPLLPEALEAARMGLVPAGAYANREYLKNVTLGNAIPVNLQDLCFDPQTSGGLLICLPEDKAGALLSELWAAGIGSAARVGHITGKGKGDIHVK
jgi:selenide,water dikinase